MKKIVSILLAALCMFALFSCGDSELKEFGQKVAETIADSAETTITITSEDGEQTLKFTSEAYVDEDQDKNKVNCLTVQYYTTFSFDSKGNAVLPDDMTGTMSGGKYKGDTVELNKLTFNSKYFKNKEYTLTSGEFYAVVTNPTAFFGTEIAAKEVEVSMTLANGTLKRVALNYETEEGNTVSIAVKYTY